MTPFVSLYAYAFGKQHYPHIEQAVAAELEAGEKSAVPGFRTLHRLRRLVDGVALHVECSTLISYGRCKVSGVFLESGRSDWVQIDEDVEADAEALKILLRRAFPPRLDERDLEPIVTAAMRLRNDEHRLNVQTAGYKAGDLASVPVGVHFPIEYGGLALSRIPRKTLEAVAEYHASLVFDVQDKNVKKTYPGLFLETIRARRWCGEDASFCHRATEAGASLVAFVSPGVVHAGLPVLAQTET